MSERRQIGGHTYEVTMPPLTPWQQIKEAVWPTLMGLLPDASDESGASREVLVDVVRALSVLLPLQPESHARALKILHDYSTVDGQAGPLSRVSEVWWSQAGYAEFGAWQAFALEVVLVPFLCELPLAAIHRLAAKARASASRITSPGIGPYGTSSAGGMGL